MPDAHNYPSETDGNALRARHLLFENGGYAGGMFLLRLAEKEEWDIVEVMELYTDFLLHRDQIKEQDFYRCYTQQQGDLLRVIESCTEAISPKSPDKTG